MAFSASLGQRISCGNFKARTFDLTDVQTAGSTFNTGQTHSFFVAATNTTDNSDTLIPTVSTLPETVTVDSVTADDDGTALVVGF